MARRREPRRWGVEWKHLSWQQIFELLWGPHGTHTCGRVEVGGSGFVCDGDELPCVSAFESDEHRRAVFERHRTLLVDDCLGGAKSGTRPWAWWFYVVGVPHRPSREDELRRLVELDALTPDERAQILSRPNTADGRPDREAALLRELIER